MVETILRRIQTINNTKIKYIKIGDVDKLYEVRIFIFSFKLLTTFLRLLVIPFHIFFTDLKIGYVHEEEVFDISDFKDFRVTLKNNGVNNIVEFVRK